MKTFEEYVNDWFKEFLDDHEGDIKIYKELFEDFLLDAPEEGESYIDKLYELDANTIYKNFFTPSAAPITDDLPDSEEFIKDMLKQAVSEDYTDLSFVDDFLDDMVYHITDYDNPLDFFQYLTHGCQSGIIGMLIYNSDCKDIYIQHIDDMEDFREMLEDEIGEPIKNRTGCRHYTFMCWLCYEELGFHIARNLFEDEF